MSFEYHKPSTWLSVLIIISTINLTRSHHTKNRDLIDFEKRSEASSHAIPSQVYNTSVQDTQCDLNRHEPPQLSNLITCHDNSLFTLWRPKARFMGSRGWLNDPMAIYQTKNGSWHIGYQCQPNNYVWGNISQCSASTTDFTYFNDYHGWQNPVTIAPSQLYDIRGVFDGSIIQKGWNGHPTIIYTSTFTGPLGWKTQPPEKEGTETQSLAYTEDDGKTWTKLNFGENGNPVIYHWPEKHLTGFRDPFIFESPEFLSFYSSSGSQLTGQKFLTISGGIREDLDPKNAGPRLFLYRQSYEGNFLHWTYLGPLIELPPVLKPISSWQGATGVNFECGSLVTIEEEPQMNGTNQSGNDSFQKHPHRLDLFLTGSEGARNGSHDDHWPIWSVLDYDFSNLDGNLKAKIKFSGVIDWGRTYAFVVFQVEPNRQVLVGWSYEDDVQNVLTSQRGYQGSFTLFRDIFVKVIRNIAPESAYLTEKDPSWSVEKELDGSLSVITLGQKIIPETLKAYKKESIVSKLADRTLNINSTSIESTNALLTNLVQFEEQPSDRYFAITAQLDFHGLTSSLDDPTNIDLQSMPRGGFRVLASESEWTDIYYEPSSESLVVRREHSSLVKVYGSSTEIGKLRLWPIRDPMTNTTSLESLNLTIIVDNSIIEVYANHQTVITTRVYPWLMNSTSVSFFVEGNPSMKNPNRSSNLTSNPKEIHSNPSVTNHSSFIPQSVSFSNIELWNGLLNAWPNRPLNSSVLIKTSHDLTQTLYSVWDDTS
ncbi:family 32 glycoside hydrolase [Melampsora larici-populina 98AG31]|uniref:Family 32 glycoside hydrolase n=1 Tax=Melampsora larici-populina (strain 98AG31 / pathotype 3-4-7) TaxID=747676 RepID=F4RWM2_MELLP|nr:family 32 glycoside hydrolase [Melampsora larici-populina 98AG31]EGG03208.1 family 32 glycoside hydrolase [Melampsora larici-populina 98AG31]